MTEQHVFSEKDLNELLRRDIQSRLANRFEAIVSSRDSFTGSDRFTKTTRQVHVWIIYRATMDELFSFGCPFETLITDGTSHVADHIVEQFIDKYIRGH